MTFIILFCIAHIYFSLSSCNFPTINSIPLYCVSKGTKNGFIAPLLSHIILQIKHSILLLPYVSYSY